MKKLSKIFAVVLCLAMAVSMLAMGVSAAEEKSVEFTVDSLGLKAQSYTADTATVDGVAVEWVQLGNYGDGIQMRDSEKDGVWRTSMFWNTDAFPGGITKIEFTYSDSKKAYADNNMIVNFGNAAKGADCAMKLVTVANVKSYTITPDAADYSFFYIEWDTSYSSYWKSIKVYYNESTAPEVPETPATYYVAGVSELCGSYWTCDDANNLMTKGENGLYTRVYENVAAASYQLKVTDGTWSNCWGGDGPDGNYVIEVTALSTVTVTFNAETKTVSVDVVPVPVPEIVPISTALAGADGEEFMVKGVVTCVEGKNIYVMDATGGICVRASENVTDVVVGDTVVGTGTKSVYNGLPQLGGSYEKSEGMELVVNETTIDALTTDDVCTYVKLTGLTVTEVFDNDGAYSLPNIKVSDGTNEIQIYKAVVDKNDDGTWAIKVGDKIDVCAAVGIHAKNDNVTLQLRNTTADEITLVVDEPTDDPTDNPTDEPTDDPTGGEDIPVTGDMSVAALVVAAMAATAGIAVIGKKKEF